MERLETFEMPLLNDIAKESVNSFSVVITIKESDWIYVEKTLPLIQRNIKPKQIILISSANLIHKVSQSNYLVCLDEDYIFSGMTLANVKEEISSAGGDPKDAGWYLQQFINLSYSRICKDPYYLVWDVDTMPLNPISFFETESKKPLFYMKREYMKVYFDTIRALLGLEKCQSESFTAEHMMINTALCHELLYYIENNNDIIGDAFWKKCIHSVNYSKRLRSFAEYETYGTYVTVNHPGFYKQSKLRTLRSGCEFIGTSPSKEILDWATKDFDIISFEHWGVPIKKSVELCADKRVREILSFADVIRYICDWIQQNAINGDENDKKLYRKLCICMELDFFFGNQTVYDKMRVSNVLSNWKC